MHGVLEALVKKLWGGGRDVSSFLFVSVRETGPGWSRVITEVPVYTYNVGCDTQNMINGEITNT